MDLCSKIIHSFWNCQVCLKNKGISSLYAMKRCSAGEGTNDECFGQKPKQEEWGDSSNFLLDSNCNVKKQLLVWEILNPFYFWSFIFSRNRC